MDNNIAEVQRNTILAFKDNLTESTMSDILNSYAVTYAAEYQQWLNESEVEDDEESRLNFFGYKVFAHVHSIYQAVDYQRQVADVKPNSLF